MDAVLDYDYATACANLGNALTFTGNQAESFAMLNRASSMFEKQIAHDPAYVEPRWALARTRIWISESLSRAVETVTAHLQLTAASLGTGKQWPNIILWHK